MTKNSLEKVGKWAIAILLGLSFIAAGWPKIMPSESMIRRFENWGYSAEFTTLIGILELTAGILVLLPKLAAYGSGMIFILMIGAIYTHLATGIGSILFAVIYLLMAACSIALNWRDTLLIKKLKHKES
ncbi:MAG: DoxX family membrane protein [Pseudomonadales bacterium]|nr:DoxX family membrane protein [Pseudomonadales bacterium]